MAHFLSLGIFTKKTDRLFIHQKAQTPASHRSQWLHPPFPFVRCSFSAEQGQRDRLQKQKHLPSHDSFTSFVHSDKSPESDLAHGTASALTQRRVERGPGIGEIIKWMINYVFALSEGKIGFKHFLLIWETDAFSFLLVIAVGWVQTIYFSAKKSLYLLYSTLPKPVISVCLSPADVVFQGKHKPYDVMSTIHQSVPALPTFNPFEPSVKNLKAAF